MALLYCLGFNSLFFFSFRRGLLATSLFCKARGLWGRLVRQSPRGELSVESSRVRADSSVSCLSSLPLWPSLTPLSPLIAVTIVILCVLPAGLCNPPPKTPHPASHNHPSPTRCHLCFDFCMTSSFIDDGLYVLKSSAGHSKKGFPVPAEAQTQKHRFTPSAPHTKTHIKLQAGNINMSFFPLLSVMVVSYKRWLVWSFYSLEEEVTFRESEKLGFKIPLLHQSYCFPKGGSSTFCMGLGWCAVSSSH